MGWNIGIAAVLIVLGVAFGRSGRKLSARQNPATDWKTTKDYGGYSIQAHLYP